MGMGRETGDKAETEYQGTSDPQKFQPFNHRFPLLNLLIILVICGSEFPFAERQALQLMRCCENENFVIKDETTPFLYLQPVNIVFSKLP